MGREVERVCRWDVERGAAGLGKEVTVSEGRGLA